MKWFKKQYHNGEQRTITKFLWLPLQINNETRWLEKANIRQEYHRTRNIFDQNIAWWVNLGFANNSDQIFESPYKLKMPPPGQPPKQV